MANTDATNIKQMDGVRTAIFGTSGTVASLSLVQINAIVGIGVGLVTGAYITVKLIKEIKNLNK